MFYIIFYTIIGIYFLLMSFKIIHKKEVSKWNRPRILALRIMAIGFLILGFYYSWFYYFINTPFGKFLLDIQKLQRQEYLKNLPK